MKKIILWTLVISCMCMIFGFSAQEASVSDGTSTGFIKTAVKILFGGNADEKTLEKTAEALNFYVRKAAHFSIYALLGFLIALLVCEYIAAPKKVLLRSVIFIGMYAASDELHQFFVPGRSCEIRDVLLDTFGALCGICIAILIKALIKKVKNEGE